MTTTTNNTVTTINTVAFRAYVANLGKYNEGEILGEWVDFPIEDDAREELLIRLKLAHRDEVGEFEEGYLPVGIRREMGDCNAPQRAVDYGRRRRRFAHAQPFDQLRR